MLTKSLKIGIVCPYSWDTPGGVQNHIRDLAEFLIAAGHEVSVLAPTADDENLPRYVVNAGKPISIPYNGAVARVLFGPVAFSRVRTNDRHLSRSGKETKDNFCNWANP